jgi:hypothetical protein
MTAPIWVERELVLLLHDRLLAEHGGAPGLREEGLLDSALARLASCSPAVTRTSATSVPPMPPVWCVTTASSTATSGPPS